MKKAIAEFIGTFALVLVGCGAAVIGGLGSEPIAIEIFGVAAAFGLTVVAMAYGIGQVSGCHINPAVSLGVLVAGRMTTSDFITYVIAQVLGAIAGAVVLYLVLSGKASGWTGSLAQNGWGPGYLGEYNLASAFIYEVIGTFLFLVCILGVTQRGAPVGLAGLAIGLTLIAIHLWGLNITGTSLNPARSLGPALDRRRDQSSRARPGVAVHPRPADRRRGCGLLVQVRHPGGGRCRSRAGRTKIGRSARGRGAAQTPLSE